MTDFDDMFRAPPVTVRRTVQINGIFGVDSVAPQEDRWDGTCLRLGKLRLIEMSDGTWLAHGDAVRRDTVYLGAYEAAILRTDAGMIFYPHAGELVRCGMLSEWVDYAMQ